MFNMLNSVNVVEVINRAPNALYAWEENQWGNQRAEEKFKKLIQEYHKDTPQDMPDEEELEQCIEDGIYEDRDNDYQLFIVHSMT